MTFPLTLAFMWLVFWRPQEWLFPWMFGWPILDVVVYGALLGMAMDATQKSLDFPKTPAVKLALGLWIASIMSHVAHTYFQGILNTYQETFKISLFLVLLLVVMNSINRARAVVLVFILASIVMSVHALLQASTGKGFGPVPPLVWWQPVKMQWITQTQFYGIFEDPNDLGQILATSIPLVFAYPRRLRPVTIIALGGIVWLLIAALLTTVSRGSMVAVIVTVLGILFLRLPVKMLPYAGGVVLIGGLVMCAVGGATLLDASARERVVFWGDANHAFKQNPLFGIGYNMFTSITEKDRAAHNAYVCCYTELGFFGYWFWSNLMTLGVIGCWRTRVAFARPRNEAQAYLKRLAGLSIAAMAGFGASAYFISRAYVYPAFFLFGLLNAIPVIAQRYLPEDHPPLIDLRRDVLIKGTIFAVGSIAYIYFSILILNKAYGGG
jgi:putative inorganic carbon (HCO3(-)) transporter